MISACKFPWDLDALGVSINYPNICELTEKFMFQHLTPDDNDTSEPGPSDCDYTTITSKIAVFWSAVATFYAPSNKSGIHGMDCE